MNKIYHRYGDISKQIFNLKNCYFILKLLLIIISCYLFNNSDLFAGGGGGGSHTPKQCSKEYIEKMSGRIYSDGSSYPGVSQSFRDYLCTPYSPPLQSWDWIKTEGVLRYGLNNFKLDFEMQPKNDSYYILGNGNILSKYITCNDEARYKASGYVYTHEVRSGNYCSKWVVGIKKDFLQNYLNQENSNQQFRPNIDIKIFCAEVSNVSSYNLSSNGTWENRMEISPDYRNRSYFNRSFYTVCRDGTYSGFELCFVVTEYKMDIKETREHYREKKCVSHSTDIEYCDGTCHYKCSKWEEVSRCCKYKYKLINASTYDTNSIFAHRYDINICQKPTFTDEVKNIVNKIYDPNLVSKQ